MSNLLVAGSTIESCPNVFAAAPAVATPAMCEPPNTARRLVRAARASSCVLLSNGSGRRFPGPVLMTVGSGQEPPKSAATASCTPDAMPPVHRNTSKPTELHGRSQTIAPSQMACTSCTPVTTRRASTPHICERGPTPRTSATVLRANAGRSTASRARRTTTPSSLRTRFARSSSSFGVFPGAARHQSPSSSASDNSTSVGSCAAKTGGTYGMSEG